MFFSILRNIGKGIFVLVAALILTEFSLRLFGFFYSMRVANLYSTSKKNNAGIIILAVGESTTGGMWAEKRSYPIQLEEKINQYLGCTCASVQIYSMPGANTSGLLKNFPSKLLEYKPDIVLFMTGVNDGNYFAYNIDAILLEKYFKTNKNIYGIFLKTVDIAHSIKVIKLAKLIYTNMTLPKTTFLDLAEMKKDRVSQERINFYDEHKLFIDTLTKENIKTMIRITERNGALPVIVTYHSAWVNSILQAIAKENNLALIDNEPSFQYDFEAYVFQKDRWHPNEKGYGIIAGNIMNGLMQSTILKKSVCGKTNNKSAREKMKCGG